LIVTGHIYLVSLMESSLMREAAISAYHWLRVGHWCGVSAAGYCVGTAPGPDMGAVVVRQTT